jgi:threonyl-tRNA synthetase
MVIVGQKELESGTVSVRSKRDGELGSMKLDEFLDKILTEIKEKR